MLERGRDAKYPGAYNQFLIFLAGSGLRRPDMRQRPLPSTKVCQMLTPLTSLSALAVLYISHYPLPPGCYHYRRRYPRGILPPPIPVMSLYCLPTELLSLTLHKIDSPSDLLSLVRASAPCWVAYSRAPSLFVTSVLRNAIHPSVMYHALAALHVPVIDPVQPEALAKFVEEYFRNGTFAFPTDMSGLKSLCRLYNRLSFFIQDYASRAMRVSLGPRADGEESPLLSETERARFQRAFFRYEIYSLAFPLTGARYGSEDPFLSAQSQFASFLSRLEIWEVEEMSCVYLYFMLLVGSSVDAVEDQLVAAALAAPGARSAADSPRDAAGGDQPGYDAATSGQDADMATFNALDLTNLSLFSIDAQYSADETVGFLASVGSLYIYQLTTADSDGRRDLLRRFSFPSRDFLPEALNRGNRNSSQGSHTTMPEDLYDPDPRLAGPGYYLFKRHKQNVYLPVDSNGLEHNALRERAYVFWDGERIFRPQMTRSLVEAASMTYDEAKKLYGRNHRPSVEVRLQGLRIPSVQMLRIRNEFGYPEPDYTSDSDE